MLRNIPLEIIITKLKSKTHHCSQMAGGVRSPLLNEQMAQLLQISCEQSESGPPTTAADGESHIALLHPTGKGCCPSDGSTTTSQC